MKMVTGQSLLGLQLLNYLTQLAPQQRVNISEIASYYQVSHYHLIKVVGRLNRLGYIHARRGKGGGIMLQQSPEKILLGHLIRALEPMATINHTERSFTTSKFYRSLEYIFSIGWEAFFIQLNEFSLVDLAVMSD